VTPADVCELIVFCNAIAWGKVGAVVAALALTYGVAMSVALVVYMYRFRGRRTARRTSQTRLKGGLDKVRRTGAV
jgi:O-antigen/teichoic acid export membrane protein